MSNSIQWDTAHRDAADNVVVHIDTGQRGLFMAVIPREVIEDSVADDPDFLRAATGNRATIEVAVARAIRERGFAEMATIEGVRSHAMVRLTREDFS